MQSPYLMGIMRLDLALPLLDPAEAPPRERRPSTAPRTFPEQIADDLGGAIVSGRYADGERLVEQDLAATFGVSRGPVREALRLLERRGLVDIQPRRGAYVRAISLDALADLFNVRIALSAFAAEAMAANPVANWIETLRRRVEELEAGAARADTDAIVFARTATRAVATIVKGSGNAQMMSLMTNLSDQTVWISVWKNPLDFVTPERRQHMATCLRRTLQAIEAGRARDASRALREATEAGRDSVVRKLAELHQTRFDPAKLVRIVEA